MRSDGADTNVHHRTTVSPTGEEDPQLCADSKVDTLFNSAEGNTYVFKGKYIASIICLFSETIDVKIYNIGAL